MADPDWQSLQHAYGSAADLPGLLKDLSPKPTAKVWDELWSRVCHQGGVCSASLPTLPYLLDAASKWPPAGRLQPLILAGSIVSADDIEEVGDPAAFRPTIEALHRLALQTLTEAQGLSADDLIYLLRAALALGGDRLWGRLFDHLTGGEFPGVCPACEVELYLVIGEDGYFTTADDWVTRPATPRVLIRPTEASELSGTGKWLHEQAVNAAQPAVAESILHVFGSTACPACGAAMSVAESISQ